MQSVTTTKQRFKSARNMLWNRKKLDIRKKDIKPDLQKSVIKIVNLCEKHFETHKEKAEYVKTELDDKFRGPWNVVVGQKFGGVVTYIPEHFMYFGVKGTYYLVYCTRNMKRAEKRRH